MRYRIGLFALLLFLLASSASAQGRKLDDHELDQVTSAGYSVDVLGETLDSALFSFEFDHTGQSRHVKGKGNLDIHIDKLGSLSINTLTIDHGAQQNLKALVNINAVNSMVNVLLNLVINVDSVVLGSITQGNGIWH